LTVKSFEVLVGTPSWRPASGGHIPEDAVLCGHDKKGGPLYLARAHLGPGLHPGKIGPGMPEALIPFGGTEWSAREYEVLVAGPVEEPAQLPAGAPLLFWDFENVFSERGVSISAGVSAAPNMISGFVSQTGGGPAEFWRGLGIVFLTRHLGSNEVFVWFTITRHIVLESVRFSHWHNHNLGYPTHPSYQVQVQLDEGEGPKDVGEPLTLANNTVGGTDTIAINRQLRPGNYRLRWHPRGLHGAQDTSSEYFAIKGLALLGHALG
jgi:hypothetical protein